jgi:hypothetical protein
MGIDGGNVVEEVKPGQANVAYDVVYVKFL